MTATFLAACRRERTERTPVWFMRQAGRYQPEYRKIRERHGMLEICEVPDLCAEVSLLPVRQLGVDAAILFSDIMVPLRAVGIDVRIEENIGPVIEHPVRCAQDVSRLRPLVPDEDEPFTGAAVRQIVSLLGETPLIGFAGAPFTLASYLVEGGPSRQYLHLKSLMWNEPRVFSDLLERLGAMTLRHLEAQVGAGARAVQIFDSWVGSLSPGDYAERVLPTMRELFGAIRRLGVPSIYFGVNTSGLLPLLASAGADVVGVDWRIGLADAWRSIGQDRAIQGNLDPALLVGPEAEVQRAAAEILQAAGGRPGHIFNLGHGVLPQTNPDALRRLVDFVHRESVRPS